jgi:hypothetical protein
MSAGEKLKVAGRSRAKVAKLEYRDLGEFSDLQPFFLS